MKIKDIISCGLLDLKTQRKTNRISFAFIFLSIIVYIGVNSTVDAIMNGSFNTINGHASRLLYLWGEGKAQTEYEYLMEKYSDDERVQEIFTGLTNLPSMTWKNAFEYIGTEEWGMQFASAYESLFDYGYKGEEKIPEYDEIILPRYMYNVGVYDEYSCYNSDELIGKTLTFTNDAYYYSKYAKEQEDKQYQLKVIGTYDNITKPFPKNNIFCNKEFVFDMFGIFRERMVEYHWEMGEKWMKEENKNPDFAVYFFIKEGYDINEVYEELNAEISADLDEIGNDDLLFKHTTIDPEVASYYYYVTSMGNFISFVLLFIAIINIIISSINEVKNRKWEFSLKTAMGYQVSDIIKIFAVEKIANVLKALGSSLIVLFMYSKALTYYNQNMVEYWKRSWVITLNVKDIIFTLILITISALMGVVVARLFINNIEVTKTLKAGE